MQHKHSALYGHHLRRLISKRFDLDGRAVLFLHDATAFLLGEISRSGYQEVDRVVGITLGTGIGFAFCSVGKVLVQGDGVPHLGEIYNLPWANGTVEDILSTRCLVGTYQALGGETISAKTIAERAATDHCARLVMEQFGVDLGQVLDVILRHFDPQVIAPGGGITKSADLFLASMHRQFGAIQPRIHVCDQLDAAPLLGAAELWRTRNSNVPQELYFAGDLPSKAVRNCDGHSPRRQ